MTLMEILKKAGFRGQGLQMAYAIAMAESSGNAHAHNGNADTGDNSYGLFQINMLGGMGPERRRRYGLSSNNDLYDALTNAKVAYAMSNGGRNWGPWSTYHNGDYRQYYGGSGATVTSTGSYTVTPTTAKLDNATLAQMYGLTYSMIKSDSSLMRLFRKAVAKDYSADRFTAELKNTPWWRTTSDSARKFFLARSGDPATYAQKYQAAAYHINDLAVKLGVRNLLGRGSTPGHIDPFLGRVVLYQMRDGWTDARLQDYLGAYVGSDGHWGGHAGEDFDQLHQFAFANGLKQSAHWYKSTVRAIESGRSTLETETAKLRKQAAAKYSRYAQQIMAGQNAMDLAAPYIQSVSSILELPSTGIGLANKFVNKAMTAKTKDGSPYSIWQFETDLRSDPTWVKTNNARESMMSVARGVLKDFGVSW